jgi:ABC-type multidrug transport system ATPase subunit
VGPAKAMFLDEISTGLDSSTTFQIVRSLRHFAHIREATLLIALLQPTPETYHLFDDIMLLSEGRSALLHEAAAVEGNNADCTAATRRRDVPPV